MVVGRDADANSAILNEPFALRELSFPELFIATVCPKHRSNQPQISLYFAQIVIHINHDFVYYVISNCRGLSPHPAHQNPTS